MKSYKTKILAAAAALSCLSIALSGCELGASKSGAEELMYDAFDAIKNYSDSTSGTDGQSAKSSLSLTLGEYFEDYSGKEISLDTETKLKNPLFSSSVELKLDGSSVISCETISDSDDSSVYIKLDGLTGGKYLKTTAADLSSALTGSTYDTSDDSDDSSNLTTLDDDSSDDYTGAADGSDYANAIFGYAQHILKNADVDVRALMTDFKGVLSEAAQSVELSDSVSKRTIFANDISATFEKRSVSLDADQTSEFFESLENSLSKAGSFEALFKGFYTESSIYSYFEDYESFLDDFFSGFTSLSEYETLSLDFYYYNDEIAGIGNGVLNYLVFADTSDGYILSYSSGSDTKADLTAVPDGEKLDIELNVIVPDSTNDLYDYSIITPHEEASLTLSDFEFTNEDNLTFSGTLDASIPFVLNGEGAGDLIIQSSFSGDDRSQDETGNITIDGDSEVKEVMSYTASTEFTGASDITVPSGSDVVAEEQTSAVLSSGSLKSWLSSIKTSLGITDDDSDDVLDDILGEDDTDVAAVDDLSINYGIDYYSYYNENFTEFDMDGYLADAEAAGYPDMDALKESIEEYYKDYITSTPNLATLESDYGIDYYSYYDDAMTEFDMDGFLAAAEKAGYPDMDGLMTEIEGCYADNLTDIPNLNKLAVNYGVEYLDYYNDNYTEFDMDKFLADAEAAGYPDMDALKEEIEEQYGYYIDPYVNIATCESDYGVAFSDYMKYSDEGALDFDIDGYLAAAEAAGYPDIDSLESEATELATSLSTYIY